MVGITVESSGCVHFPCFGLYSHVESVPVSIGPSSCSNKYNNDRTTTSTIRQFLKTLWKRRLLNLWLELFFLFGEIIHLSSEWCSLNSYAEWSTFSSCISVWALFIAQYITSTVANKYARESSNTHMDIRTSFKVAVHWAWFSSKIKREPSTFRQEPKSIVDCVSSHSIPMGPIASSQTSFIFTEKGRCAKQQEDLIVARDFDPPRHLHLSFQQYNSFL